MFNRHGRVWRTSILSMMAFVFSASGPSWVMAETIASVTPPAVMLVQWEKPPLSRPADRAMLTSPAQTAQTSHHPSALARAFTTAQASAAATYS